LIRRRHVFHWTKAFWPDTNGKTASAKSSEACPLSIGYQSLTVALLGGLHLKLVGNPAQRYAEGDLLLVFARAAENPYSMR
jgi:hypothetical protein